MLGETCIEMKNNNKSQANQYQACGVAHTIGTYEHA